MAEWSKAPRLGESMKSPGFPKLTFSVVRKGVGSNPTLVNFLVRFFFGEDILV